MQLISPEIIFRGDDAWKKALPQIKELTKRPLILGRSESTNNLRKEICKDLMNLSRDIVYSVTSFLAE